MPNKWTLVGNTPEKETLEDTSSSSHPRKKIFPSFGKKETETKSDIIFEEESLSKDEERKEKQKKKIIAFSLATVGVVLMAIGLAPLFSSDSVKFSASIVGESNTPLTTAKTGNTQNPPSTKSAPLNPTSPAKNTTPAVKNIVNAPPVITDQQITSELVNVPINTHTGETETPVSYVVVPETPTESLHSGAPDTIDSGPLTLPLAFGSLGMAFLIRRLRYFSKTTS